MITEIFQKRHPDFFHFSNARVPGEIYVFLRQGAQIIFNDLIAAVPDMNELCYLAYAKLVRELGHGIHHGDPEKPTEFCRNALWEQYDLWNNSHGDPELFISARFSLLELLFAEIEKVLYNPNISSKGLSIFRRRKAHAFPQDDEYNRELFRSAVRELNIRFREAGIPLQNHNGLFQLSSDKLTNVQIEQPFWDLLKNSKWTNVDIDIKEALDRRDNNNRDAALYTLKALEST